ncbi:Protein CBG26803 [Caenorhabditis briggsae]|uniref:Protein CBG26803 n=1 Tax=Caenorhabditis briggsae TaxID=6238 RepID=B6IIB9_CAEBR|nr:Protein CBG26803 [Caenorhabditis briggsae]CAR99649.1 Protein CBG26803 [Caenorhabditis briggsae]
MERDAENEAKDELKKTMENDWRLKKPLWKPKSENRRLSWCSPNILLNNCPKAKVHQPPAKPIKAAKENAKEEETLWM